MTNNHPRTAPVFFLRQNYRLPGQWVETGFARPADDGIGLKIQLGMLPVSGFDGHILLRPIETETPLPLAPQPEEDEEEDQPDPWFVRREAQPNFWGA